jgi:hypothetical protein
MQFTGIIKNKARVLSKVVYLDVVTKVDGPHKQWVLFKDKHTMQDINTIANAEPGSSIIVDGKDNINQQTQLPQVVVNKLINIIPQDADLSNTTMPDDASEDILNEMLDSSPSKDKVRQAVGQYALKTSKQDAIVLLCQMITGLTTGK